MRRDYDVVLKSSIIVCIETIVSVEYNLLCQSELLSSSSPIWCSVSSLALISPLPEGKGRAQRAIEEREDSRDAILVTIEEERNPTRRSPPPVFRHNRTDRKQTDS